MLAEKRRKTRYVLNPIKKPLWTSDSNGIKFGKLLMEKMGWSAGKGLGANEQGMQEPLRVFSKNDTRGMGYKKNEENWVEYQDEFNLLLNQLANNADNDAEIKEAKKGEVMSLEEKSKLSKARVHYQKFTRGKDLSKYSENDLSCILGIGKMKKTKKDTIPEKKTLFENNIHETSFGVTTINKGSIKDYFKKKKTENNLNLENSSLQQFSGAEEQFNEEINGVLKKKSKKREKERRNEFLHVENGDEGNENKEIKKDKKIKKLNLGEEVPGKKEKYTCEIDIEIQKCNENPVEIENSHENISDGCIKNISKSKVKRKKKRKYEELTEIEQQSEIFIDEKIKNEKKKMKLEEKSRNSYEEEVNGNVMEGEPQNETLEENLKKTKKRKKEKKAEKSLKTYEGEIKEDDNVEKLKSVTKDTPEKKTSRKKNMKLNAQFEIKNENNFEKQCEDQKSHLEDDIEEELVKKRKKKKLKEVFLQKEEMKNADENVGEEFESEINIGKKKKKKKEKIIKEVSEKQINGDFMEVELENQMVEKKSVKKKKKCLEESIKEEEELINKKVSVDEVAVAADSTENNKKSEIYAETEFQPEEERKNSGKKKKKEGVELKIDELQENILESEEKKSKEKKRKTKSKSHLDISRALGVENEINNIEKKENENSECLDETGKRGIHTHKTALLYMKKPFLGGFKNCSTAKVLNLICGAEIERFKGSNLGNIPGYGCKKKNEKNVER